MTKTLKTFVHTSASGNAFDAVKLADLIALLAHATGQESESIAKIVVPNGADYALIFRPKAPKAEKPKVSKGAAGDVTALSDLSPKAQAYVRAMAERVAAGKATLVEVVERLRKQVRILAETLKTENEDDLILPGDEDDDLDIPEEKPKARGPKMAASKPGNNVSRAAEKAAMLREVKRKMAGR